MKNFIKSRMRFIVPPRVWKKGSLFRYMSKKVFFMDLLRNCRGYYDDAPGALSSARLYGRLFEAARIKCSDNYIYTYDPLKVRLLPFPLCPLTSITPDYSVILRSNINAIRASLLDKHSVFAKTLEGVINAVLKKADNISNGKCAEDRYAALAQKIPELLRRDCESLDEAIQKLLFYNGLFWQVGHRHNGLGRLDLILAPYYQRDMERGIITYDVAKRMLRDMCRILGSQIRYKSANLIGDTGQYILLGGIDHNGNNVDNDLTHMILEIFTEMKVPDPKLIVRVNSQTPKDTWLRCVKCLFNGCGSPLLMNEELIMDKMVRFGYERKDVWNVGTSACWEPLIIGKSSCQNNPFRSVSVCDSLLNILSNGKDYDSFENLFFDIKCSLVTYITLVVKDLDFDYSPLMSLFMPECLERERDFSHKGSKYMHQGVQLLGLPNLVDSLLNIKEYVFDKNFVTLNECKEVIRNNYKNREDLRRLFASGNDLKFGSASPEVLSLCKELIEAASICLKNVTANGNRVKFGLSSPNYISQSKDGAATLDGRKAGDPYAVHISPVSSSIDICEILNFAASLDYPDNCLNGNVVDFIVPSSYQKQPDKLVDIICDSFSKGVFQLQLNVLDKQTLIEARNHPEKYPDLVVRVWGFSAYFNELPEEYKENLIARAETYGVA